MSIDSLGLMASKISDTQKKGFAISERLASGGTQSPWSRKTSAQIDVSISTSNKVERLQQFQQGNALVKNRLSSQLYAIDDFMKLAQRIKSEFMPGSYTMDTVKPGLASTQNDIKDAFQKIGNRINSISGEYVMGGVATQNPPMKNVTGFTAYTGAASDYSAPVSGSITVYINDEGDTVSFSGNDFDEEVTLLYRAIEKLGTSTTGADAASDQASALAADAQKALLNKYYQKLEEISLVEDQDDELLNSIQQAMTLKEQVTEDNVEALLSALMSTNIMGDISQHLLTQEIRNAQSAARMMDK